MKNKFSKVAKERNYNLIFHPGHVKEIQSRSENRYRNSVEQTAFGTGHVWFETAKLPRQLSYGIEDGNYTSVQRFVFLSSTHETPVLCRFSKANGENYLLRATILFTPGPGICLSYLSRRTNVYSLPAGSDQCLISINT